MNDLIEYLKCAFAPATLSTWFLVVLGIVAGVIAMRTLRHIKTQAEAATRTLISTFRPHIHIRRMRIMETEDSLFLEVILVNRGDSNGQVTNLFMKMEWHWTHTADETEINTTTFEPFGLLPGESAPIKIILNGALVLYRISVMDFEKHGTQGMTLRCVGEIAYLDDNKTQRQIGFDRRWNHETKRFIASDDPEEEFAD